MGTGGLTKAGDSSAACCTSWAARNRCTACAASAGVLTASGGAGAVDTPGGPGLLARGTQLTAVSLPVPRACVLTRAPMCASLVGSGVVDGCTRKSSTPATPSPQTVPQQNCRTPGTTTKSTPTTLRSTPSTLTTIHPIMLPPPPRRGHTPAQTVPPRRPPRRWRLLPLGETVRTIVAARRAGAGAWHPTHPHA